MVRNTGTCVLPASIKNNIWRVFWFCWFFSKKKRFWRKKKVDWQICANFTTLFALKQNEDVSALLAEAQGSVRNPLAGNSKRNQGNF